MYAGDTSTYQDGGDGYDTMHMQDQNYGYNPGMADQYYGGYPMQAQQTMMYNANGYPVEQPMMYDANGYPVQQPMMYDANGYPMQPMSGEEGGFAPNAGEYDEGRTEVPAANARAVTTDRDGERRGSGEMRKKKSFTGPPEGAKPLAKSRSVRPDAADRKAGGSSALARNGSLFKIKSERETQRSVSTRGSFGGASIRSVADEQLVEYYGDMAKRRGEQRFDGIKAVKSYRGEIKEGEDIGKPRRVVGARGLQGKGSTGYGGLNFKRECAMRNGETWGDIEVRRKGNEVASKARGIGFNMSDGDEAWRATEEAERRRREMEEMMRRQHEAQMMAMQQQMMMDQPAVPRVFSQEDVHSYSNLSDAFADDQMNDDDDDGFYQGNQK